MSAFVLLGLGLAAVLFAFVGRTVQIVAGKRYRVKSKLRGADLNLIERGLAEFGATDVALELGELERAGDEVISYTVTARRTKAVRLGVDKFTFDEDPATPGETFLVIDELEEAA